MHVLFIAEKRGTHKYIDEDKWCQNSHDEDQTQLENPTELYSCILIKTHGSELCGQVK